MNWMLLVGSLIGVLGLAAFAWLLGLGGGGIEGAESACATAAESLADFDPADAFVSSDGKAALVLGRDGALALVKAHGTQLAVRRLGPRPSMRRDGDRLIVASGERMFGDVVLHLRADDRDTVMKLV